MPVAAPAPIQPERLRAGVTLRLCGMFAFAILSATTKLAAAHGASTAEIILYRNLFALLPVAGAVIVGPGLSSLRTSRARAHATRAALGYATMWLAFQAIVMLPLAEAVTISFTAPLFATVLSSLLLGERVGAHRWAAIAAGLAGVVVVMSPGRGAWLSPGIAVALVAAFATGFVTITLRQIGATDRATTTVFWFTLACTLASLPVLLLHRASHDAATWGLLAIVGIVGGIQQLLNTAALRYASVSAVAPFDYTQLVWAILFGWLLLGTTPVPATLAGGALIVAGGLYTLHRERRLRIAVAAAAAPVI